MAGTSLDSIDRAARLRKAAAEGKYPVAKEKGEKSTPASMDGGMRPSVIRSMNPNPADPTPLARQSMKALRDRKDQARKLAGE